jgi:hypothetical protein
VKRGALAESNKPSGMIFSEIDVQRLGSERRRMGLFSGNTDRYETISWDSKITQTGLTRHIPKTPFVPGTKTSAGSAARRY